MIPLWAIWLAGLYWAGLQGGFFFDDAVNILTPEGIQMTALNSQSLYDALSSGIASIFGRPISQLSFALNHYISAFDPYYFKLTNLIIHLLNGVLVNALSRKLFKHHYLAALVTTLWLIHPIQLTSVLYVVQRMTSLSALFLLLAFLMHIKGREQQGIAVCLM